MPEQQKSYDELVNEVERLRGKVSAQDKALKALQVRNENRKPQADICLRFAEFLPDAAVITDSEGTLLFANEQSKQLLGLSPQDVVAGRSLTEFIRPEDPDRDQRALEEPPQETSERALHRADESIVYVESTAMPIQYRDQPALFYLLRELTGKRRMELALSETQHLFYQVFQAVPAAISLIRLRDGVFLDVNQDFLSLTGYDREEAVGTSFWKLNLLPDTDITSYFQPSRREHTLDEYEINLHDKNGELRTVLLSTQHILIREEPCLLVIFVDITERIETIEAEQESRDLFRKVFHASPTPIALLRKSDGQILDVNKAVSSLTDYRRIEMLGRSFQDLDFWTRTKDRLAIQKALMVEGSVSDYEFDLHTKKSGQRTVLGSFQHISVHGEPGIMVVLNDITEQKAREHGLIQDKIEAEALSRLKMSIFTNITHEVRTPLTVILGFTSMLRQGVLPKYQRFVDLIERSGRRLTLMLDTMLDMAQLEAGTLNVTTRQFDVLDIIHSEIEALRPLARDKNLNLEILASSHPVRARMDDRIFARVFSNILDNAIKFTEEGDISIWAEENEKDINVMIRDTGIGINETFLPHIFDEFSQESTGMERTHQGSGLGLTVSQRLLNMAGGHIEVESMKGEGSLVTITLPR